MVSSNKFSALLLLFCLIIFTHVSGQQGDFNYPYAEGTVIAGKDKGFMNYLMATDDLDKLKFAATFYDSLGKVLYNQSIALPKLTFLGVAYNGTRAVFLFKNQNTSSLYNVIFEQQGKFYRVEEKKTEKEAKQVAIVLSNVNGFFVHTKMKGGFKITKLNYDNYPIWTTEFKGEKKTCFAHKHRKHRQSHRFENR